jgi:hypothetical protein
MLWHHGVETLVMLLGAYMQAPRAAHAYVLKCKTENVVEIGEILLQERLPKYHRLTNAEFTLANLMRGIHRCSGWADLDDMTERFTDALRRMLADFTTDKHRWEYNAIKHGLRASHGGFSLAAGIEETRGTPAPLEAMEMVGQSQDSSFFHVAKPLQNATKSEAKRHFSTERVAVTWTLERVLIELQLLSIMIHNVASALRVAMGAEPGMVQFKRIANDHEIWNTYNSLNECTVPNISFSAVIQGNRGKMHSDKEIFASYKAGSPSAQ